MSEFLLLFLKDNWLTLTTLLGGVVAWFVERSKRKHDLKIAEVEYSKGIISMYDKALVDIPKQFEGRLESLEKEVKRLNMDVEGWKNKYLALKKQFEDYRKKHA
jgi:hypothetical protein